MLFSLVYDPCWWVYSVYLRRIFISSFHRWTKYSIAMLGLVDLYYSSKLQFRKWLQPVCPVHFWNWVVEASIIIFIFLIFPFNAVSFYFKYFGALFLDTSMFISFWYIDHLITKIFFFRSLVIFLFLSLSPFYLIVVHCEYLLYSLWFTFLHGIYIFHLLSIDLCL